MIVRQKVGPQLALLLHTGNQTQRSTVTGSTSTQHQNILGRPPVVTCCLLLLFFCVLGFSISHVGPICESSPTSSGSDRSKTDESRLVVSLAHNSISGRLLQACRLHQSAARCKQACSGLGSAVTTLRSCLRPQKCAADNLRSFLRGPTPPIQPHAAVLTNKPSLCSTGR